MQIWPLWFRDRDTLRIFQYCFVPLPPLGTDVVTATAFHKIQMHKKFKRMLIYSDANANCVRTNKRSFLFCVWILYFTVQYVSDPTHTTSAESTNTATTPSLSFLSGELLVLHLLAVSESHFMSCLLIQFSDVVSHRLQRHWQIDQTWSLSLISFNHQWVNISCTNTQYFCFSVANICTLVERDF